jgi:phosphate transport system protein
VKHTEQELLALRKEVNQMWQLVMSQLSHAKQAYFRHDAELAREIISREKRVDAFELKIDSDSENYIALYSPVAIDLRLVLSLIKISAMLERIGDFAETIARQIVASEPHDYDQKLWEDLHLELMFDLVISMLSDSFVALEAESVKLSGKILAKDEETDEIYRNAIPTLVNFMAETGHILHGLQTMLLIRKIERIGDYCGNIAEEIVFYIDAKVLKHAGHKGAI